MQLSVDQYNEIYGTNFKELTPIEFSDYISYLMDQVKLKSNNEDIFSDIEKLV